MAKQMAISGRAMRANVDRGPVRVQLEQVGIDQARVLLSVDYSRTPPPDISYFADYCDVRQRRSWINLIFGKLTDDGKELRTRVEIAFPETLFNRQLWNSSEGMRETVARFVAGKAIELTRISEGREKIQTFQANNVFMALQGEEAVLDFYYLSAKELFMVRNFPDRESSLIPVIRICTDTYLLDAFFRLCEPHIISTGEIEVAAADSQEPS